jgi:hypothetical protein
MQNPVISFTLKGSFSMTGVIDLDSNANAITFASRKQPERSKLTDGEIEIAFA